MTIEVAVQKTEVKQYRYYVDKTSRFCPNCGAHSVYLCSDSCQRWNFSCCVECDHIATTDSHKATGHQLEVLTVLKSKL